MGITLANFQLKAIEALMEAMGEPNRDIILKSCTGSGKTIPFRKTNCEIASLSKVNEYISDTFGSSENMTGIK